MTRAAAEAALADPRLRPALDALAAAETPAWIVGGTVRDALLGRRVDDLDVVVAGSPEVAARAVGHALRAAVFPLSEQFGAWRVVARDRTLQCDVSPLHGETIEEDLGARDFSVNAIALAVPGGETIDPHGGRADLDARRLRVLGGPTLAQSAYAADPLRPLRLVRLAAELGFAPDAETERLTREAAPRVPRAAAERVFVELRRLVLTERPVEGLELATRLRVTDAVLPELAALRGVEQSHFHHLDVYGHTLEVLRRQLELERSLDAVFGELAPQLEALLSAPVADGLTASQALRFAALVHDIGKPATRALLPDGRVSFVGHDSVGEQIVGTICRRLHTSERLREFLGKITRHHLVLGFMVHERPLTRAAAYRYLTTCSPVEVEVTVLSCADRLATRGRGAERAIAAHLELARELMAAALEWRRSGPAKPAIRGDRLARALDLPPGPRLGTLMAALAQAAYTGEATTADEAVELARRLLGAGGD
jgi:poly(A) polymerase